MVASDQIGQKISHYRIEKILGTGGMGIVYRAIDLRLERTVALKFLQPMADEAMRQQLIIEAQAASALDHPNICTIYDVEESDEGELFLVMAYYEGESLDKLIARGPLEVERAITIAIQIGRGLAAAHRELIVHRDIKPGNLMLSQGETVKILDFGLAKTLKHSGGVESGYVIGTPAYMSPEQLKGENVDNRTDIWSLGVVIYQMLTGRLPFSGENVTDVIKSVLESPFVPPSEIRQGLPKDLDQIIMRALTRNVRHRYDRIEAMVNDLQFVLSSMDTSVITLRLPKAASGISIAVLPFEDMSRENDQQYLCEGIAEEILRALNQVQDIHVASRTSSFQFRHRKASIREIGLELNVNHILEGSVRRAGDKVRISAQLINAENGYRLWYERYDREITDIFAIEDEIAEQITGALQVTLVKSRGEPGGTLTSTEATAYQLYLQGRQFFQQHRRKSLEIALQNFARAIEVTPDYAQAYAGMADCHSFLSLYFGHGQESIDAADDASRQALDLAPELADAHSSRGLALFLQKKLDEAESHLQRAIELDPKLYEAHYIFGRVCFSQGKIEEAAHHFRESTRIVPEAYDSWYLMGMCYRRLGQTQRARNADLECIESVKKRVWIHPDDTRALTMGAAILTKLGEPDRAVEWVERALAIDADEPIIEYNAACVYASLSQPDKAISCLRASLGQGGISIDWVINDPDLDPIREDRVFKELVASLKMESK